MPFMTTDQKSEPASAALDVMMLAPWVVAMRMPDVMYEVATPWHATGGRRGGEGERAIVEKTAAAVESFGVVQAEMMSAWSNMMTSALLGEVPDVGKMSRSFQDISDAGMQPMAKRVRANYQRLQKNAS